MKKKKAKIRRTVRKKKTAAKNGVSIVERRSHPRVPICARVRWGGQEQYLFTRDLSAAGLFLFTDHPPPVGEEIHLELSIQFVPEVLQIDGKVVRHESEQGRAIGCGVRFRQADRSLHGILGKIQSAVN